MGIYYLGGAAPSFTLASTLATTYTVRNYYGTIVSSGAVSSTTLTPTAPAGGWKCGWYRLNLTGTGNDANYGASMGTANFIVIRTDARFPTNPAGARRDPADPNYLFEDRDEITRGVLCLGPQRNQIQNAVNPGSTADTTSSLGAMNWYLINQDGPYYFTQAPGNRPRPGICEFPNGGVDYLEPISALRFYAKTEAVDSTSLTVTFAAGTSSGSKITVTLGGTTEVYDNQTDKTTCAATITAASALVKVIAQGTGSIASTTYGPTAITRAKWNGVVTAVSTLYPLGCTRFEGPENEAQKDAPEVAHMMRLFAAAVHVGNAAAKAVGPCQVQLDAARGGWYDLFFAAGGGAYCDEITFHYYNCALELNQARNVWAVFTAELAAYGLSGKALWQTEQGVCVPVFGIYKPRAARFQMLQHLFLEQNGVPREHNIMWYDASHGFWGDPCFFEAQNSLNPQTAMLRTLAEETYDRPFTSALTFGPVSTKAFLGNVYTASGGAKTVALLATSYMPGATVTLNVAGATGALTVVDAFGNTSTVTVANGQVTVPIADVPTYLELPTGVTPTVDHCCDWPTITAEAAWASAGMPVAQFVTAAAPASNAIDGTWTGRRDGTLAAVAAGAVNTWTVTWPGATRTDRLLIFAGYAYTEMRSLTDFDVQTSVDGTTWVTQATVTSTNATTFANADVDQGCTRESYWDEQYVFDVKFAAPVTCKAVRLNVRATSYGDIPDAAGSNAAQTPIVQQIVLQEVLTLCDRSAGPQYVRA